MAYIIGLTNPSQLQVIRHIGDRPMAKGAHNLPLFQKKHARHLLPIFFDRANSILEQSTLEPGRQHRRTQRVRDKPKAGTW